MTQDMSFETAARCLADLGHPHRLLVFRLLVQAGEAGMPVGAIQRRLGIPKSTLAHHLAQLMASGLMTQSREGRVQRCRINAAAANALLRFFVVDCCDGLPDLNALRALLLPG